MEPKTKKKIEKKPDMFRSIGKQSGESMESVLTKKEAVVERICRKARF